MADQHTSIYSLIAPAFYAPWNDAVTGSAQELWLPGGRYSGKSTFAARVISAILSAKGREDEHAVIFRRHQIDLRDSVYTEMELAMRELGVDWLWSFKTSPLRIIRKDTGQMVVFQGLDDPRKHKSKKPPFGRYSLMWFEETDEFDSFDDIESVQNSYQRNSGTFQTFFTFNPPRSTANWANAECARHLTGRKVYHTDYRDLAQMGWIPQQILDRIENCRMTRPEVYRHVYLGEATGTRGEIFTNVKDATFTDEQVAAWRKIGSYGQDYGIVNDPTVLEGTYYDADLDYLYVFEESVLKHPYYTTIHEDLKKRGLDKVDIIADTAPAGWYQNINMLGARLHGCYKADGWPETGVSWMRNRTRIVIDSERCPLAWDEMVHYEYDTYANGKPKEKLPDRNNHAIDAIRMSQESNIKSSARKRYVGTPVSMKRKY